MRVLVCGDRHWEDREMIHARLSVLPEGSEVVEGEARGADSLAREVAEELGFEVLPVPAQWEKYRRAAGPIRNAKMLELEPDLVIAFHDNLDLSRGTKNMVDQAVKCGIPYEVHGHGIFWTWDPEEEEEEVVAHDDD